MWLYIEEENGDEPELSKTPKKIKRSHKQKQKGRATHEPVSQKQKSKSPLPTPKGTPAKAALTKKALMQGLLVLKPSLQLQSDAESLPNLIVGRSSRQNERVTFDIGRDHHLWFHVQGFPGSHCLLQLEPGETASDESIQYAADVASYFSQARGSTQVPVGYSSPKYIKRISGAAPGTVSVLRQEGVVYGNPERGKELTTKFGPEGGDQSGGGS